MPTEQEVTEIAAALYLSVGLFKRRLRQLPAPGELSLPESSALRKLERGGPATVSALARAEQISAQSMGATLITLETRGLVSRQADPADRRARLITATPARKSDIRMLSCGLCDPCSLRTKIMAVGMMRPISVAS